MEIVEANGTHSQFETPIHETQIDIGRGTRNRCVDSDGGRECEVVDVADEKRFHADHEVIQKEGVGGEFEGRCVRIGRLEFPVLEVAVPQVLDACFVEYNPREPELVESQVIASRAHLRLVETLVKHDEDYLYVEAFGRAIGIHYVLESQHGIIMSQVQYDSRGSSEVDVVSQSERPHLIRTLSYVKITGEK